MARNPSKIMSIAEKKVAQTGLKTALKTHLEGVKAIYAKKSEAERNLADAKKTADKALATSLKQHTAVLKKVAAEVKVAQKVFAAAAAVTTKASAAAAKGTEKLTSQIAAIDAAPTLVAPVIAVRVKPVQALVMRLNGSSPNVHSLSSIPA